jgi:hypothetical protein
MWTEPCYHPPGKPLLPQLFQRCRPLNHYPFANAICVLLLAIKSSKTCRHQRGEPNSRREASLGGRSRDATEPCCGNEGQVIMKGLESGGSGQAGQGCRCLILPGLRSCVSHLHLAVLLTRYLPDPVDFGIEILGQNLQFQIGDSEP